MKVFVIIVSYNGIYWLKKNIGYIYNESELDLKILLIDNGSTDNYLENIKQNYKDVIVLDNNKNIGFANANNIGIAYALSNNADFVFLLNQDAWVHDNTIKELIRIANSNPEFGILTPIHINGSNTGLDYNFSLQASPDHCKRFYSDLFMNKLEELYEINFVNAAAWLISKKCLTTVGYFEPNYFMYGEDDNYIHRAKFHNFKIGIAPKVRIHHDRENRDIKVSLKSRKNRLKADFLTIILNINYSFFHSMKGVVILLLKNIIKGHLIIYSSRLLVFLILNSIIYKLKRDNHKKVFYLHQSLMIK